MVNGGKYLELGDKMRKTINCVVIVVSIVVVCGDLR